MTEQSTHQSIRPLGALERLFASYVEAGAMFFAIPVMVKGHLTAQVVNEALAKTQARHRLLNVTIGYSADDQLSFIESVAPITARLIEGSEEQLSDLLATEVNTPFDGAAEPLMRLTSMIVDESTILVGTFHHSIADGRSAAGVMVDLLSFIGGLELPSIDGFEALDTLLGGEVHRFPELSAVERAKVQVEPLPEFEKSVVTIADYSAVESRNLFSAAKSNGTSVHSALTVAFARAQLAIDATKGGRQLRVMSPVDVKPLIGLTDQMGAFVSIAVLPFEKDESPFWEAARSVSASIAPYRTRQATQGFIAAITKSLSLNESFETTFPRLLRNVPFDGIMTNPGVLDIRTQYGTVVVEKMWPPALRGVPGQDSVAAATFGDRLTLVHTGGAASPEMLREMMEILKSASER